MILAAVSPAADTATLLFTIDRTRNISEILIVNRTASSINVIVWGLPHDQVREDKYRWASNIAIPANSTLALLETTTFPMALGEKIEVQADATGVNFILIG